MAKARTSGTPVIYLQRNEGSGEPLEMNTFGWHIHAAIAPAQGDVVVQTKTPDSF